MYRDVDSFTENTGHEDSCEKVMGEVWENGWNSPDKETPLPVLPSGNLPAHVSGIFLKDVECGVPISALESPRSKHILNPD